MNQRSAGRLLAAATLAGCTLSAAASTIMLQPDEQASKDVFLYEFDVPGVFGMPTPSRATNLDTQTLSAIPTLQVPFGNFLGAARTDPFSLTPGGPLREHGTRTLLQFDVSSLALQPAMVSSAFVNLYALPALRAFESPNAANPVTTDLRRVTGSWSETGATWDNAPSVEANPTATVIQSGVDQWVRFDVTGLVRDWLTNPASNMGVELSQRDVVELTVPQSRDRYFASLYASSAAADSSRRPFLEVNTVAEPSTYTTAGLGLAPIGWMLRRRRAGS